MPVYIRSTQWQRKKGRQKERKRQDSCVESNTLAISCATYTRCSCDRWWWNRHSVVVGRTNYVRLSCRALSQYNWWFSEVWGSRVQNGMSNRLVLQFIFFVKWQAAAQVIESGPTSGLLFLAKKNSDMEDNHQEGCILRLNWTNESRTGIASRPFG